MNADERVAAGLIAAHPEDAARLLESGDPVDTAALLAELPTPVAAEVYRALGPASAAACATAFTEEALAAIVDALPLDAAAAAMRGIEPDRRDAVLPRLEEARRAELGALLAYAENSAAALADPLALALTDDLTVADAHRQLRATRAHLFHHLYVVARDRTLLGFLTIPELMMARPREKLAAVMQRDPVRLDANTDLGTVAVHPAWRDFDSLPVTDAAGRLLGAIRHRTIRRLSWVQGRPMMATLVGLSEVYWAGLSGILASLARQTPSAPPIEAVQEEDDVS